MATPVAPQDALAALPLTDDQKARITRFLVRSRLDWPFNMHGRSFVTGFANFRQVYYGPADGRIAQPPARSGVLRNNILDTAQYYRLLRDLEHTAATGTWAYADTLLAGLTLVLQDQTNVFYHEYTPYGTPKQGATRAGDKDRRLFVNGKRYVVCLYIAGDNHFRGCIVDTKPTPPVAYWADSLWALDAAATRDVDFRLHELSIGPCKHIAVATKKQLAGWECGYYFLFYVHAFFRQPHATAEPVPNDWLNLRLPYELPVYGDLASMSHRARFTWMRKFLICWIRAECGNERMTPFTMGDPVPGQQPRRVAPETLLSNFLQAMQGDFGF